MIRVDTSSAYTASALAGKTIVVTGASGHVGWGIALAALEFTGEIRFIPPNPAERVGGMEITPPSKLASVLPPTNLPEPTSELIGRDDDLTEVMRMVAAHRLVTLTGAGGIGKTRLALASGLRLRPQFASGRAGRSRWSLRPIRDRKSVV